MKIIGFHLIVIYVIAGIRGFSAAPVEDILLPPRPSCPMGEYLSANGTCAMCSLCDVNMELDKLCSDKEDTVCKCQRGYFLDKLDNRCWKCRDCPMGSNTIKSCSATSDSQCSSCPEGKFYEPNINSCQTCSRCDSGEIELRPCGALFDTVCIMGSAFRLFGNILAARNVQPDATTSPTISSPTPGQSFLPSLEKKYSPNVFFYFLALALVILVVFCYTAIRSLRSYDHSFTCPKCLSDYSSPPEVRVDLEAGAKQTEIPMKTDQQPRTPLRIFRNPSLRSFSSGESQKTLKTQLSSDGCSVPGMLTFSTERAYLSLLAPSFVIHLSPPEKKQDAGVVGLEKN